MDYDFLKEATPATTSNPAATTLLRPAANSTTQRNGLNAVTAWTLFGIILAAVTVGNLISNFISYSVVKANSQAAAQDLQQQMRDTMQQFPQQFHMH